MIEWRDSGYYLAKGIKDVAIPSTIQDVIMARVDSLPEGAKNVLQTGSAIGREFSCELIKRVTGVPQPEITSHLSALRDSELLYERGIFPQATYIFRHSLTQEVAYDSLLQKRKQEIHERVGQAIEALYTDRLEEFYEVLAHHYSKTENSEKALQYLELSGNKATRNYAKWEAIHYYKEAIGILNGKPETEENKRKGIQIRLLITTPMRYMAYPEGSLEILEEGEKLSQQVGDERSLAHFHSLLSFYYTTRGQPFKGKEYAENSFREAEKVQDIELMVPIGLQLCFAYMEPGEFSKVTEMAAKLIAVIENTQRQSDSFGWGLNVYAVLFSTYGTAMAHSGDLEKAEALCEKGLRLAQEIDDLYCIGYTEWLYSLAFSLKEMEITP
jgi:DNA-binding transcriptional ArsR family regulator